MKKYIRNVLAFTLSISMLIPLTACKKKKAGGSSKHSVVTEDDPYYTAEEIPIKLEVDTTKKLEYSDVSNPKIVGDQIFASYTVSYEMPEEVMNQIDDMYNSIGPDECPDEDFYNKINDLYKGYYDSGVLILDMDGNVVKKTSFGETGSLGDITPLNDGGFLMTSYDYEPGECKESVKLVKYNKDMEVEKEIKLDDSIEDLWGGKVYAMDNGNFLIGSYSGVYVIDANGKLIGKDSNSDMQGNLYKVDGKYYAFLYKYDDKAEKESYTLNEIDPNTGKISSDGKECSPLLWSAVEGDDGYYTVTSNGIEKINILDKKAESEMILDWNWTDLNRSNLWSEGMSIKSDEEMYFVKTNYIRSDDPAEKYSGSETVIVKLKKADKNPHVGKTIIEIGMAGMYSETFTDYIVSYNKDANNKSRIITKDYTSDVTTYEEYEKMLKEMADKVYLEMLSGEGPDILVNFSSYSQFNNDEVLVDLNKLIDGENGFSRDEYFDNVFRAFETRGKMYQIPVCVDISGYLANKDIVGDRSGWTYDEFESIAKTLPEDVSMMEETQCSALLQSLMSVSTNSFVDYEKKEVHFDSEDFKKLLTIAKNYGTTRDLDSDMGMYETSAMIDGMYEEYDPYSKLKDGVIVMMPVSFYDLRGYAENCSALKEKSVFLGAPAPEASGMSASPMLTLAISQFSSHQEEAWDFIKFMFAEEQQLKYASDFWSLPLSREALQKRSENQIEEYNRDKEEAKKWGYGDDRYYQYDLTQETVDGLVKIVEGVKTISSVDPGLLMIINEEAPAFFENQRSVDDVCKNIQNRATTLLHER
ncbi:MAG: extracellular solute-binding protein [Clostridiales bacterium]|nr:extracellular solute-binding protein [Clostridiales bacterium]